MHTSFLSAAVTSLLVLSASAAPTAGFTSTQEQSPSIVEKAQLPGIPHPPVFASSVGTSSSGSSETSETSESSASSTSSPLQQRSNQDLQGMKDLVLEIKRSDGQNAQKTNGGNGEKDEENHATWVLGSPISLPARGGQGGRNVA